MVAIKTINVASSFHPALRARFQAEAELSAKLQHRNIVQIYSIGESDGVPYFSMELVNGPNLADAIAERPLDPPAAARLVATLARAIHYATTKASFIAISSPPTSCWLLAINRTAPMIFPNTNRR